MQSQLAELCTIPVQFSAFDRTSDARFFVNAPTQRSPRAALQPTRSELVSSLPSPDVDDAVSLEEYRPRRAAPVSRDLLPQHADDRLEARVVKLKRDPEYRSRESNNR